MKDIKILTKIILIILLISISCKNSIQNKQSTTSLTIKDTSLTTKEFITIADTIIYDVIIKNPDSTDYWIKECLQYVKIDTFINSLFNKIYKQEIIAYDIFTDKPISIKDLKRLEKEDDFSRKNIAKLQFTEKWYFDSKTNKFHKKLISISFGYEVKNKSGKIRGYKPLFKLKFE